MVVTMVQACVTASHDSDYSHSRQKRGTQNADYNGQKFKQEQFEWDSLDA